MFLLYVVLRCFLPHSSLAYTFFFRSSLTFFWHHVQMHQYNNVWFWQVWNVLKVHPERERKRGGDAVFPNFLSYTTLCLMCVCLQNMMNLKVNFLLPNQNTHAHIKWREKQLIKTSYGSTKLSNVPFSQQSKMLPGKIPTLKLNNNESRPVCPDKNRNICARRCNLFIYSQLRDNILMNKTNNSSRMTQRENQAHMCHSRVPGAGGLSPTQTLGKKANVVHRKTGKESQQIKYLPDKSSKDAVCHLTMSINLGAWL